MTTQARRYLMCPPEHFDVVYEINPWMDASAPVDRELALQQWQGLVEAYRSLGHVVEVLPAEPGLPDMVFAANGATAVDGVVLGARFASPQRVPEAHHHLAWHRAHADRLGWRRVEPLGGGGGPVNEAEGDFAVLDDVVLAGHGYRTTTAAHRALEAATGRRVVSLRLVDPRYYHLDTALMVLDDRAGRGQVAWYPPAFDEESREAVRALFPEAVVAADVDAEVLGLNGVSDGRTVVLPARAEKLAAQLQERGYGVVPVDLSELLKGGGSVKCCTQELRPARSGPAGAQSSRRSTTATSVTA